MFCPQCKSEYRAGYTHCSDCNAPLVDRLPAEPLHDIGELVRVHSYSTSAEAFLARSVLESSGIDSIVTPPDTPALLPPPRFGIGLEGTDLYVRSEDYPDAVEILKS